MVSCGLAARIMLSRKLLSHPARSSLPRMASIPSSVRATFKAGRHSSAGFSGPCPVRLRYRRQRPDGTAIPLLHRVVQVQPHVLVRRPPIALQRRHVVTARRSDRLRRPTLRMHRVRRDDPPLGAGISNNAGTAVISFDLPSTRTYPITRRASLANARTRCSGEREAASENDRRNALPSMATTSPPNRAARPSASRSIACCRLAGSSSLNGLMKASRLGMPCARRMNPRGNPSSARPKRSMSAQPSPPHRGSGEGQSSASRPSRGASRCSDAGPQLLQIYEQTLPCRLSPYALEHTP